MKKTTLYLPDDLKREIERAAQREGRSEAEIIREAIFQALLRRTPPQPRIPLTDQGLGVNVAEHVDRMLDGFGR